MNKKQYPIPATIVIRLNGDETTATIMGDEFRTRITRSLAKRNPKDEYDAYIGARVALDRLFGKYSANLFEKSEDAAHKKDAAPENTQPRWKIGDRVIATGHPISPDHYGKEGTVTKVGPAFTHGETRYYADFGGHTQTWCSWNTDAVKSANEKTQASKKSAGPAPKFQVGDIVRVTNALLSCGRYDTGDVAVVTRVDKKVSELSVLHFCAGGFCDGGVRSVDSVLQDGSLLSTGHLFSPSFADLCSRVSSSANATPL